MGFGCGRSHGVCVPGADCWRVVTVVHLDLQFIAVRRRWERLEFPTARAARSYLLQIEREEGARREGTGAEGRLVRGKGSAKRVVAMYEIAEA